MLMMRLAMISHNLEPANHCADCEEPQSFRTYHTKRHELLSVDVSSTVED